MRIVTRHLQEHLYQWATASPVFGASGYAGGELIRLVDGHPDLDLAYLGAHTSAGETLGVDPPPSAACGDRILRADGSRGGCGL